MYKCCFVCVFVVFVTISVYIPCIFVIAETFIVGFILYSYSVIKTDITV